MTSLGHTEPAAATETSVPAPEVDAPDGVSEMFERRAQRRAKRDRPRRNERTMPAPRHPRPNSTTAVSDAATGVDRAGAEQDVAGGRESAPVQPVQPEPAAPSEADHHPPDEAAVSTDPANMPTNPEPADATETTSPVSTGDESVVPPQAAGTAKTASNAALSWAAAARKQAHRLDSLAASVSQARAEGVPTLVLGAALADAEYRAGQALPAEIWTAAGH